MTRALTRRLAAVATAGLVVAGLASLFAPPASATQGLTVLSESTYTDSTGYTNIVGEVKNTGTTNVEFITLNFDFVDNKDALLAVDSTYGMADLAPGEKTAFHELFHPPVGYDHYRQPIKVTATDRASAPNHNFTTAVSEVNDTTGNRHLSGTVRNDNTTSAEFVRVSFTFYDAAGKVVNSDLEWVADDAIAPGGTSTIEDIVPATPAWKTFTTMTESDTAAAPAGGAPGGTTGGTPGGSTGGTSGGSTGGTPGSTASPSAGATGSPSPGSTTSASPRPSRPPSPTPSTTESPSADVAPTVSLSSSAINAGDHVTVSYTGAPGSTLQILARTQPATAYSVIGSVALDPTGHGTSSHAPTKNTRVMARTAGGLTSAQPLIQVRSVASVNARRISAKTYTFSGRVYPGLSGRLVNVYRNGALVAQARTAASGVYSVTRTLAAGTFSFQSRTGNDTYNLGATSPTKIWTIS